MAAPVHARRLSAGWWWCTRAHAALQYLLLRAYRNWDFPKGLVEPGELPLDAAMREVKEETTLENLCFDWGESYIDTGPYNKGKISRYYIARSNDTQVQLPINPELGFPEHQEARWVGFDKRAQHGFAAAQAGDPLGERYHCRAGGRRSRQRVMRPRPISSTSPPTNTCALAVHVEKQRGRPATNSPCEICSLTGSARCIAKHHAPKLAVAEPVAGSSRMAPPTGKKNRASA